MEAPSFPRSGDSFIVEVGEDVHIELSVGFMRVLVV